MRRATGGSSPPTVYFDYQTDPNTQTASSATKGAFTRRSSVCQGSWNGATPSGAGANSDTGTQTIRIGNNAAGDRNWTAPIKLFALYKATLSNAQIQAL
jgi:hypothetical protein